MTRLRWAVFAALGCVLGPAPALAEAAPACPQATVRSTGGEAVLEWSPVPGADGYEVFARQDAAFELLGHTKGTSWRVPAAAGYVVVATAGASSSTGCAQAHAPAALPTPLEVLLSAGGTLGSFLILRRS